MERKDSHILIYVTVPEEKCPVCPLFSNVVSEISKAYFQKDKKNSKNKVSPKFSILVILFIH